jgi:L-erythro-3,5-diaminohexanoate dehydrogenase
MNLDPIAETAQQLGADRVLSPAGALPQPAERLDPAGPCRSYEFEIAVDRLCVDSTSYRSLRERAGADSEAMAARIREIVAERGKLHNPDTESGGVLVGTVSAVGERVSDPPREGQPVVTLGSLTTTPLRIERVVALDPDSPQVEVEGVAYVFERAAWAPLPGDLPLPAAVDLLDVCAAASQVRELAPSAGTVCVLGAGHGGKLALAAARDSMSSGTLVAVDADPQAVARVRDLGLCDLGVVADLRDPIAAMTRVRGAGMDPADLTVVVVNATGCEPAALLLTADRGTVLLFSMATSFQRAALAADGIGTAARMVVGSGYSPDRGSYALDLVRRVPALREALAMPQAEAA